jgi:hypothetical protein
MTDGSAAECAGTYAASEVRMERRKKMTVRWKAIPWTRIIIDTLLVAAMMLASSSFMSVR